MFINIVFWFGGDLLLGLLSFVPALLLSILTPLFLPSLPVSLFYFIFAVPMREWLGKHSFTSSPFPLATLNGILCDYIFTALHQIWNVIDCLIDLLFPTFALNSLLLHTLPNSLTNPHNWSESATSAVSSANTSWFISNLPPFTISSSSLFHAFYHLPVYIFVKIG